VHVHEDDDDDDDDDDKTTNLSFRKPFFTFSDGTCADETNVG
jgi:hypothetical protein